jgi:putative MATE family efflux protein
MPSRPTLTEGPIGRTLLVFSLPILGSSILQSLNASINAIWIGRLLGEEALTASANANALVFFLLGTVFGLGIAASVLVAQGIGAKNIELAKRTVGTSLTTFVLISIVFAGIGITFAPHVLSAMRTPPDALPLAAAYLRVIFAALPGMYLYTFIMMALRGAGDARTPFVFLLLSAALDVGLNPVLIRGFGPVPALGIAGSALATLISQYLALAALLTWLYRSRHFLRLERHELHYLRIDRAIFRALITKGLPTGLQIIVMSSSMIAMISIVNRFGSHTTAAYGACFQLWSYVQMPCFAVGNAVSAMAAQNVGANRWDRVTLTARAGVTLAVVMTAALVVVITLVNRHAFALFLGPESPAIDIALHAHRLVSWSFVIYGVGIVLSNVVRSTGAVMPPLVILFVSLWLVRVPTAAFFANVWGVDAIWWSFPMGSTASATLIALYYRFGRWREARMLRQ